LIPRARIRIGDGGSGAAEGHTIGHHTWLHRSLMQIPPNETTEEIDRGIAADEMALHGVATTTPNTPFFRFPGFEMTPATLDLLQLRGRGVRRRSLGQRLESDDAEQELKLITDRLKIARKGIIPVPRPQSANRGHAAGLFALPAQFRRLRPPIPTDRDQCSAGADDAVG